MVMSQESFLKVEIGLNGFGQFSFGLVVFCFQDDFVQIIGVSAVLGVVGVVFWGDLSFFSFEVIIDFVVCYVVYVGVLGLGRDYVRVMEQGN